MHTKKLKTCRLSRSSSNPNKRGLCSGHGPVNLVVKQYGNTLKTFFAAKNETFGRKGGGSNGPRPIRRSIKKLIYIVFRLFTRLYALPATILP